MHARVTWAGACTVVAAMLLVGIGPVAAQPSSPEPPMGGTVTPVDAGLLGRVRAQVEELNSLGTTRRVPCTGVDERDEDGTEGIGEFDGYLRWRITRLSSESWHDTRGTDPQSGTYYRRECWAPAAGEFGSWDGTLQLFDAINPENLARLAMDEFFLGLEAPVPRFNPASPTLVDFDTWLWVEGIESPVASEVISVPGLAVQAFAEVGGVEWVMGDGGIVACDSLGTPYGPGAESSDCTYLYERSSAAEPNAAYQGVARIVWTGTYTVNGALADAEFPIPRETPFTLGVAEAQAINVTGRP